MHFAGTDQERQALDLWLAGWSESLAEMNYLRTGHQSDGLLDVHYVTDEDIARQTSYAAKIGAITDPARELPLGKGPAAAGTESDAEADAGDGTDGRYRPS